MITASAWKFTADDEGHVYRIQVNNVDGKTRPIVEQSLHDWEESGEGWNNDGQILFFVKKFPDTEVWEEWTKKFKDFNLKVLDREGKAKKEIKVKTSSSGQVTFRWDDKINVYKVCYSISLYFRQ